MLLGDADLGLGSAEIMNMLRKMLGEQIVEKVAERDEKQIGPQQLLTASAHFLRF